MQATQEVEIGRSPTQEQLASWYQEHNITPEADGSFTELPYGPSPVEKDCIVEQVRVNAQRRDVRNLTAELYIPRTMVFVAGGPSLEFHLEEIRAKALDPSYDVYTSNQTCKYLLSKGITPKFHIILDPTERKAKDLEYDCDEVTLVLGLQCHPKVFESIGNRKAFKFLAASATDRTPSDVDVAKEACTQEDPNLLGIGGGSMTGTRMMYFAAVRGYRRLEYYGLDASISYENGRVRNYAYNKQRAENILEVEAPDGRKFFSTLAFSRQVNEMQKLMDNLPGLEVVVHGDSFMSHMVRLYKEQHKPADYRISPAYRDLQKEMFANSPRYAKSGHAHAARVFMAGAQLTRRVGKCEILDYGCGKESLRLAMEAAFPSVPNMTMRGYDPNREGLDAEPEPAELVTCTDVLEHVEPECVDAVLRHLHDLTKNVAILVISTRAAFKDLPDGRNAHISLHDKDWWDSFIGKYFVIIEETSNSMEMTVVAQPIWKYRERKA